MFHIPHGGWQRGNSPCLVYSGCLGTRPRISRLFRLPRLDDTNIFFTGTDFDAVLSDSCFFLRFCRSELRNCTLWWTGCTVQLWTENGLKGQHACVQGSLSFLIVSLTSRRRKDAPLPVNAWLSAQGVNINSLTAILNSV